MYVILLAGYIKIYNYLYDVQSVSEENFKTWFLFEMYASECLQSYMKLLTAFVSNIVY